MSRALPLTLEGVGFAAGGMPLLAGVNLRVEAGEAVVLLGHNGAGKSLLLRLCHGLLRPTEGRLRWAGPADRRHAMVFQRPVMLRRSVAGNLRYALWAHGVPWRRRGEVTRAVLERFGLAGLAERPARVLSGGEQQRLALARAWALEPEVLFLDEPTAALDPGATLAVEQAITAFRAAGTTIVMATHDLAQARRLASRAVFLAAGRVVEDGPADRALSAPTSPQANAYIRGDLSW
ncbi:MAG: ATP-binding cassette domain-containing protein [Thalassobaculales bacterium]